MTRPIHICHLFPWMTVTDIIGTVMADIVLW